MWVYGRTDLADFYRDRLTLRQVWVRLTALPPEAPWWAIYERMEEEAKAAEKVREVEDTLARFKR